MKRIKIDKKLSLNKETIARLSNQQMNEITGGQDSMVTAFCYVTISCNCKETVTLTVCPTGVTFCS